MNDQNKTGLDPKKFEEQLPAYLARLEAEENRAKQRKHLYDELHRLEDEEREERHQRLKTLEVTTVISYDPATRRVDLNHAGDATHVRIPETRCGQAFIPDENDLLVAAMFALLPLMEKFAISDNASMIDPYAAERLYKLVSWKEEAEFIKEEEKGA